MRGVREDGTSFEGSGEAKAKLFQHGGSQAVRLPKAFRFDGDEVTVRREGKSVILEPKRQGGPDLWARIDAIEVDEPLEYPPQDVMPREYDW